MLSVAFAVFLQCTPPRCKRENVGHAGSRSKIVGVVWGFSKNFTGTKILLITIPMSDYKGMVMHAVEGHRAPRQHKALFRGHA